HGGLCADQGYIDIELIARWGGLANPKALISVIFIPGAGKIKNLFPICCLMRTCELSFGIVATL
ncbi:MAG: hypothetical protein LUP98_06795, partial [Methylococcaceae bacterium]|nr:hypothetical protein [Methylococcaceae bacterium]